MREAGEAVGMRGDRFAQHVVDIARERDAFGAVEQIGAGTGSREHLHGDAGLIHFGKAQHAKIGQVVSRQLACEARRKAMPRDVRPD